MGRTAAASGTNNFTYNLDLKKSQFAMRLDDIRNNFWSSTLVAKQFGDAELARLKNLLDYWFSNFFRLCQQLFQHYNQSCSEKIQKR